MIRKDWDWKNFNSEPCDYSVRKSIMKTFGPVKKKQKKQFLFLLSYQYILHLTKMNKNSHFFLILPWQTSTVQSPGECFSENICYCLYRQKPFFILVIFCSQLNTAIFFMSKHMNCYWNEPAYKSLVNLNKVILLKKSNISNLTPQNQITDTNNDI